MKSGKYEISGKMPMSKYGMCESTNHFIKAMWLYLKAVSKYDYIIVVVRK